MICQTSNVVSIDLHGRDILICPRFYLAQTVVTHFVWYSAREHGRMLDLVVKAMVQQERPSSYRLCSSWLDSGWKGGG